MKPPKILIIDDLLGKEGNNLEREAFCRVNGLMPIREGKAAAGIDKCVALATFVSGQKIVSNSVENDLEGTIRKIKDGWNESERWSLLLLDLHFKTGEFSILGSPEGRLTDRSPESYFGLQILNAISSDASLSDLPIVLLSSMDRTQIEERLASLGALGFVEKNDLDAKKLADLIDLYGLLEDEKVIGRSLPLLKCLREARTKSRIGNRNILITGESGTGKELFGRYIFENSLRFGRGERFNTVFLSGVPESLVDDLIFGHEKGAFFGAFDERPGVAETANQGTVFFDEIGDIPAIVQGKLLRLLDENIRETRRIGGRSSIIVDIMILLATERLEILQDEKLFRSSLVSRMNFGSRIHLPPLRERKDDILLLAKHFLQKLGIKKDFSQGAIQWLKSYHWPRNVRELELLISGIILSTPDLNVITEIQFDLARKDDFRSKQEKEDVSLRGSSQALSQSPKSESLDDLLEFLQSFDFHLVPAGRLEGLLPYLRLATAKMLANYLKVSFSLKKQLTNTIRFMENDPDMTTLKAASTILDIVEIAGKENQEKLLEDDIISEIVSKALKNRKRKTIRSKLKPPRNGLTNDSSSSKG